MQDLLVAVLDSWDRGNRILTNLLQSLPEGGLEARATAGSPSVRQMFGHMYHERMISLQEETPEFAGGVPEKEWAAVEDRAQMAELLADSGRRVRNAVDSRVRQGRQLDLSYDHPILFLQLLSFHEAYHHGQIKLALKLSGVPLSDDVAGPLTWDVWRRRTAAAD
ncbi:MAG: hypothetical protein JNK87_26180 [Bryobacterales bacterium]|nr:hypothetical protein [Bryobacterales bacterium]